MHEYGEERTRQALAEIAVSTRKWALMNPKAYMKQRVTVEEIESRAAQNIAVRRIIDAKEIGYLVAFLASPKATAITGEVIAAGGGSGRAVFQ